MGFDGAGDLQVDGTGGFDGYASTESVHAANGKFYVLRAKKPRQRLGFLLPASILSSNTGRGDRI